MPKQPAGFRQQDETTAIFARVPTDAARKLDRAAAALRVSKREIVTSLLSAIDTQEGELLLGRAEVSRADPRAEVLTPRELAELLQVDESTVLELAERGELPGRRLGGEWRFARTAVLTWLGG